jgi:hypothetical protein
MSLLDAVRAGVAIANAQTKDLQAKVRYEKYTGTDGYGAKTYASAKLIPAIVDWQQKQLRTPEGTLSVSRASVTFLDPTIIVDDNDRITLPDGTTGPILDMAGFIDAGTGHPILTQVFLG